ncbi:MAG: hypothetical protein INR71_10700 [Terriglobus roseus]|nr:hypothetical protein [Terriglobus roseus]
MSPVSYGDEERLAAEACPDLHLDRDIVAIEHPCIVKNVDKGLKSLGGPDRVEEVSERRQ